MLREKVVNLSNDTLLTTEEAAALLGLKPRTLAKWRMDESIGLAFTRVGPRAIRYRKAAVDAFLEVR